jgi:hypothetical protein
MAGVLEALERAGVVESGLGSLEESKSQAHKPRLAGTKSRLRSKAPARRRTSGGVTSSGR